MYTLIILLNLVLINTIFSFDNAIGIEKVQPKNKDLLIGLIMGAVIKVLLTMFIVFLLSILHILYIFTGIFIIFLAVKNINVEKRVAGILLIILIDIFLSFDNVIAMVAITKNILLILLGVAISTIVLFYTIRILDVLEEKFVYFSESGKATLFMFGIVIILEYFNINISSYYILISIFVIYIAGYILGIEKIRRKFIDKKDEIL